MWLKCRTLNFWIGLNTVRPEGRGGDWAEWRGLYNVSANINNNSSIVSLKLLWKKKYLNDFFLFLSQDVHFPLIRISALSWGLASCPSIIYWRHILYWTQRWVTARAWVLWPACCYSICVRRTHSTCSNSSCMRWGCGNSTDLIWSYYRYSNIHMVKYMTSHDFFYT